MTTTPPRQIGAELLKLCGVDPKDVKSFTIQGDSPNEWPVITVVEFHRVNGARVVLDDEAVVRERSVKILELKAWQ